MSEQYEIDQPVKFVSWKSYDAISRYDETKHPFVKQMKILAMTFSDPY